MLTHFFLINSYWKNNNIFVLRFWNITNVLNFFLKNADVPSPCYTLLLVPIPLTNSGVGDETVNQLWGREWDRWHFCCRSLISYVVFAPCWFHCVDSWTQALLKFSSFYFSNITLFNHNTIVINILTFFIILIF